jgi:positive regulator of sigma E activity
MRGTLSAFFVVGVMMSLSALMVVGRFGLAEVWIAIQIMPGLLLGFLLSRHLADVLDRGRTRNAVLLLSAVGGVVLIVRQMF